MTTLPPDQLAARLRHTATGDAAGESATNLLIAHDRWLHRNDFVHACVEVTFPAGPAAEALAEINWHRVPDYLDRQAICSPGDAQILGLAAELAGVDVGRPLRDLLAGLNLTNRRHALDAIGHVLDAEALGAMGRPDQLAASPVDPPAGAATNGADASADRADRLLDDVITAFGHEEDHLPLVEISERLTHAADKFPENYGGWATTDLARVLKTHGITAAPIRARDNTGNLVVRPGVTRRQIFDALAARPTSDQGGRS